MPEHNVKMLFVLLLLVLTLSGCVSTQDQNRVVARNKHFVIVEPRETDTYASLAKAFIGNEAYASVIARYNPVLADAAYVAIPLTAINPSAVLPSGYQQIPVLCYHQFTSDSQSPNRMVVTQSEFDQQMRYLRDNGYQIITLSELYQFIQGKQEVPDKAVVITIDDGYRSYLEVAVPILRQYQIPSTIFVYPDFVGAGSALSWNDVTTLVNDPLIDVQSHSKSHGDLAKNEATENDQQYQARLQQEVVTAAKRLERKTGHDSIHFFAYPYGNTSRELIDLLERNNYQLGLTVERGSNTSFSDPFLLNRTMIYGGDSMSKFVRTLDTFVRVELK